MSCQSSPWYALGSFSSAGQACCRDLWNIWQTPINGKVIEISGFIKCQTERAAHNNAESQCNQSIIRPHSLTRRGFWLFFFFIVTSLANSSNLALFSSCCFARQDGRLFKLWNVSRCGHVIMTDGGCYLEAPVGCEGIVKEVELKASNIHLVHLKWGFNFTYDIHVWLLKFTCVFLVMPKPMNLSSNWGVSALATYRGSYLKMYFSTLSLKVSNHVVGGCLDISLVCCVKLWSLP